MLPYPFAIHFHNARMKTLTTRVLCLSGTAAVLVIINYVVFFASDHQVLEEFHESSKAPGQGVLEQPYMRLTGGISLMLVSLIVPCCGIAVVSLMVALGTVETYCRPTGSCPSIMKKACKYHKSELFALQTYGGCLEFLVSTFPPAYAGLGVVLAFTFLSVFFQCASAKWGNELYHVLDCEDICDSSDKSDNEGV